MNRLKGTMCYLAGPMDEVPDMGKDWRTRISEVVWGLDAGILNPCDKPTDFAREDGQTLSKIKLLKQRAEDYYKMGHTDESKRKLDEVHDIMRKIVAIDLRMVDIAHFVILNVDKDYHMCGSYSEQTHAAFQRKPVIVHCKQGVAAIPNWLHGMCNHNLFFDSWSKVEDYLNHIAHDVVVEHYNRWRFFDFDKVFGRLRLKEEE